MNAPIFPFATTALFQAPLLLYFFCFYFHLWGDCENSAASRIVQKISQASFWQRAQASKISMPLGTLGMALFQAPLNFLSTLGIALFQASPTPWALISFACVLVHQSYPKALALLQATFLRACFFIFIFRELIFPAPPPLPCFAPSVVPWHGCLSSPAWTASLNSKFEWVKRLQNGINMFTRKLVELIQTCVIMDLFKAALSS